MVAKAARHSLLVYRSTSALTALRTRPAHSLQHSEAVLVATFASLDESQRVEDAAAVADNGA